jgi:hypothetical protein
MSFCPNDLFPLPIRFHFRKLRGVAPKLGQPAAAILVHPFWSIQISLYKVLEVAGPAVCLSSEEKRTKKNGVLRLALEIPNCQLSSPFLVSFVLGR